MLSMPLQFLHNLWYHMRDIETPSRISHTLAANKSHRMQFVVDILWGLVTRFSKMIHLIRAIGAQMQLFQGRSCLDTISEKKWYVSRYTRLP